MTIKLEKYQGTPDELRERTDKVLRSSHKDRL